MKRKNSSSSGSFGTTTKGFISFLHAWQVVKAGLGIVTYTRDRPQGAGRVDPRWECCCVFQVGKWVLLPSFYIHSPLEELSRTRQGKRERQNKLPVTLTALQYLCLSSCCCSYSIYNPQALCRVPAPHSISSISLPSLLTFSLPTNKGDKVPLYMDPF